MTSAAVSGGMASRICTQVQSIVQTKNGTLRSVMPGQRMRENRGDEIDAGRRSCRCR